MCMYIHLGPRTKRPFMSIVVYEFAAAVLERMEAHARLRRRTSRWMCLRWAKIVARHIFSPKQYILWKV